MSLSDTEFSALADAMLNRLAEAFEASDEEGILEVDLMGGILTIELPSGRQFLVSKHSISQQLWLSSPLSGGLHFDYEVDQKTWVLKDKRRLDTVLKAEVETLLAAEEE